MLFRSSKGELVVEHNVDKKVELVPLSKIIAGDAKHGNNLDLEIASLISPNYGIEITEEHNNYFDSTEARVEEKGVSSLRYIGSKNAAIYTQTLVKNKEALLKDLPIDRLEFDELLRQLKYLGGKRVDFYRIRIIIQDRSGLQ